MPPADVFLLYHPHLLGRVVMLCCAQERRRGAVEARALRLGLGFIRQPGDLQGAVNRLTTDADLAGRFAYAASGSAATCLCVHRGQIFAAGNASAGMRSSSIAHKPAAG